MKYFNVLNETTEGVVDVFSECSIGDVSFSDGTISIKAPLNSLNKSMLLPGAVLTQDAPVQNNLYEAWLLHTVTIQVAANGGENITAQGRGALSILSYRVPVAVDNLSGTAQAVVSGILTSNFGSSAAIARRMPTLIWDLSGLVGAENTAVPYTPKETEKAQ